MFSADLIKGAGEASERQNTGDRAALKHSQESTRQEKVFYLDSS